VRRFRAFLVVAVAVVTAGACASSGYNAGKLQSELRQAGLTPTQAKCVTDAMGNEFDVSQLGSHTDPTGPEDAETRAILAKCGVKLPEK
jgi:hypothetical protein